MKSIRMRKIDFSAVNSICTTVPQCIDDGSPLIIEWADNIILGYSSTPRRSTAWKAYSTWQDQDSGTTQAIAAQELSTVRESSGNDKYPVRTQLSSSSPPTPPSRISPSVEDDLQSSSTALDLSVPKQLISPNASQMESRCESQDKESPHPFHIANILRANCSPTSNEELSTTYISIPGLSPAHPWSMQLSDSHGQLYRGIAKPDLQQLLQTLMFNFNILQAFGSPSTGSHSFMRSVCDELSNSQDSSCSDRMAPTGQHSNSSRQDTVEEPDGPSPNRRKRYRCDDVDGDETSTKGCTIYYYPEPSNSKLQVKAMLDRKDPRLRYVNDGAAIKNPFAVDRKIQLAYLMKLLCVQTDNGKYLCKGCNRETEHLRAMQQHLLSHSASKFHLCVRCLKGFNDKYDMKRHTRKHTLIRPYSCPECSRSFSQRCSLEGHRRKIHRVRLQYTRNQRREIMRVCESCGFTCSTPVGMLHHVAKTHPSSSSLPRLLRQFTRTAERNGPRPLNLPQVDCSTVDGESFHNMQSMEFNSPMRTPLQILI